MLRAMGASTPLPRPRGDATAVDALQFVCGAARWFSIRKRCQAFFSPTTRTDSRRFRRSCRQNSISTTSARGSVSLISQPRVLFCDRLLSVQSASGGVGRMSQCAFMFLCGVNSTARGCSRTDTQWQLKTTHHRLYIKKKSKGRGIPVAVSYM